MEPAEADWLEEDLESVWNEFLEEDTETDRNPPALPNLEDEQEQQRSTVPELAVVERDLPHGLFGFTRTDSAHVNVNKNLYKVDKERTIRHEKTHHLHPKDELTIRYINGDIDVRNTLSFQANQASRIGRGNIGVNRTVAAYGAADDNSGYRDQY